MAPPSGKKKKPLKRCSRGRGKRGGAPIGVKGQQGWRTKRGRGTKEAEVESQEGLKDKRDRGPRGGRRPSGLEG